MSTSLASLITFSVAILTAVVELPKLVVPNLPDLTVKTRYTSGDQFSEVRTLYLKGSRQRSETVTEKPARADAMNSAAIWQCDVKRRFFLNQRDKIYNSYVIEDRSERLKKARLVSSTQMSGADVVITIDPWTPESAASLRITPRVMSKLKPDSKPAPAPQPLRAWRR
jgi:hypothetical protein